MVLVACGGDATSGATGGSGGGSGGAPPGQTPTWWEDVAPIVYDNCVGCHQEGGIAPIQLEEYADVDDLAGQMRLAVESRRMPPFPADNSGDCNTYRDARWLTQEQIDTISAWAEGGAPEGDPANRPDLPGPPAGLDQVDRTLDIGADYEPSNAKDDDYRCFIVDPEIQQDMYLTGFEVKPGDSRVVHHVILFALDDAQAEQEAQALDDADPGLGYTCFGGARVSSTFSGGWAPGTPATLYPEGTGIPLKAGRKAVMQIHYNTINGVWADRTTMDLRLAASVDKEAIISPIADYQLALPPAQDYVETSASMDNPAPVPVTVWGVFPHMHELGQTIRVTAERSGEEICLVDVPSWDFNWQQFYMYEEPVTVMPGDLLSITCGYSTLGRDETVYWGDGTQDEMCLNFFYVTAP